MVHSNLRSNVLSASLTAASLLICAATGRVSAQVFGADTSVTHSDRFPNGGYTNGSSIFDGGENEIGSSAGLFGTELDSNGTGPWNRGIARASAAISGATVNPLAPILRAEVRLSGQFSNVPHNGSFPNAGSGLAEAGAVETYQYTGVVPITLSLTYNLHADFFTNGVGSENNYLFLSVGVLSNVNFYSTSLDTLIFEGGATLLGSGGNDAEGMLLITATTGGFTNQTLVLPFDVLPGQIFSVVARMGASITGGTSYADAYSTATGTFDRPDLITSLSAPTPSAAGLLALGGLAGLRRRR